MRVADILTAYDEGRWLNRSFSKSPSQATNAGIWFDLSMSPGNPVPQYYFAAPLVAAALSRSADGGLDHGPEQAGYTKYLHKLLLQTATAAAAPLGLELMDYLMFYPGIAMDVGPQSLTTNIALPRQTVGREGNGVQVMAVEQSPYASSPAAQFFITYTNSAGVSGQVSPIVTCNTQIVAGTIATSATATIGGAGRFIPLAHGDSGVRSIESIEFTVGDVGLVALVLVKSVARTSIVEITAPAEIDFMQERGYLPVISPDAYLNFIVKPAASLASAPITGEITTVWDNT